MSSLSTTAFGNDGPTITGWKNDLSWTFTGVGTVSGVDMRYRRIGDSMQVKGFFTAGTPTAVAFSINLPSGFTIDTTKLTSSSNISTFGILWNLRTAAFPSANAGPYPLFYDGSTNSSIFLAITAATTTLTKVNGNAYISSGESSTFEFNVPITQFS